eukprot:9425689-Alexandrium_andersonii.AAC.1
MAAPPLEPDGVARRSVNAAMSPAQQPRGWNGNGQGGAADVDSTLRRCWQGGDCTQRIPSPPQH